jgi:hypothetical protein
LLLWVSDTALVVGADGLWEELLPVGDKPAARVYFYALTIFGGNSKIKRNCVILNYKNKVERENGL